MLHAGAGPEDPPLPIGFGEKPAKPPKAAKEEVEAAAGGEDKAAAEEAAEEPAAGGEAKVSDEEAAKEPAAGGQAEAAAEEVAKEADAGEEADAAGGGGEANAAEDATAGGKVKAGAAAATLKSTSEDDVTIQFAIDHWHIENLKSELRFEFEEVKATGIGACSKCRLAELMQHLTFKALRLVVCLKGR